MYETRRSKILALQTAVERRNSAEQLESNEWKNGFVQTQAKLKS